MMAKDLEKQREHKMLAAYRQHLCELHIDDGIKKCLLLKCPMRGIGCYNFTTYGELLAQSQPVIKKKAKRILKEEMAKEGWTYDEAPGTDK